MRRVGQQPHTRRWRRTAGLVLVGLGLGVGPVAGAETAPEGRAPLTKIGYMDVAKVFADYQRTKDLKESLGQKGKQKQGELEGRLGELKHMREKLELMNDQTRESASKQLEEKSDEFQRLKQKTERELLREQNQLGREIINEIERAVGDYARANEFALIVDQRSLLYGADGYDITDAVLKTLNEQYAATTKGKKGSKP